MDEQLRSLETIRDIRNMMDRSSRFISLSGWSGIAAGSCALVGAYFAAHEIGAQHRVPENSRGYVELGEVLAFTNMVGRLIWIAVFTFIAAFVLAFIFTWSRSKKQGLAIWGKTSLRLMVNVMLPMIAGGIVGIRLLQFGYWEMIAPCCLVFYGLALINGSKYTLGEIKYLGLTNLVLGLINLWCTGYGLLFWAAGFGLSHILYGLLMWYKYERKSVR